MTQPPPDPKIYHIVNVDRLPSIIAHNRLLCDSEIIKLALPGTTIGMGSIKERRLRLPVDCYANAFVGNFVPFYFCPRSVMLYVIHCANSPELAYKGGQGPIVHLEADLHKVIQWADANNHSWAFSGSNAGAAYAQFWKATAQLDQLNWQHIAATQWAQADIKEAKQAEFLMYNHFPWHLVERIGVHSKAVFNSAVNALAQAVYKPTVETLPHWYY
jgi:ssDNA thymidine ADP-ribosyltransferase, DarT